jgi:hypothetical protein
VDARINKMPRSDLSCAQTGWSARQNISADMTTPAAPFWNGTILLMARPPLLFKEGKNQLALIKLCANGHSRSTHWASQVKPARSAIERTWSVWNL